MAFPSNGVRAPPYTGLHIAVHGGHIGRTAWHPDWIQFVQFNDRGAELNVSNGHRQQSRWCGYMLCYSSDGPLHVNSPLTDFCIWGPPKPDSTIANTEGELVAWCTKPGRGTRIIPSGALTGVQFMQTPDYLQVTGHINQSLINILAGDTGGGEHSERVFAYTI